MESSNLYESFCTSSYAYVRACGVYACTCACVSEWMCGSKKYKFQFDINKVSGYQSRDISFSRLISFKEKEWTVRESRKQEI